MSDERDLPEPLSADEIPNNIDDLFGVLTPTESFSPFHPELDSKYPILRMFSPENLKDVAEGLDILNWASIFRNSPARNMEAEGMMGMFLTAAARAGQWVDIPPKSDEPMEGFEDPQGISVSFVGINYEFGRGTGILEELGFVKRVTDDDGGEWLSPTEKLMEFYSERLKRFGPKEG